MKDLSRVLIKIMYFILTAIVISAPALYAQYPLINGDSDNYIWQSVKLIGTGTNPIGYALFIRATTWQFSLWPVVFAQGLILSLLIYFVLQSLALKRYLLISHFTIISFLSFFTGMSWVSSQIMADVFASVAILSFYLFIIPDSKLYVKIFAFICLVFSFLTHFSIPLITIFLALLVLAVRLIMHIESNKSLLIKLSVIILAFIGTSYFNSNYNLLFTDKPKPPDITHVLLMARIMETGILDEFLEENCEEDRYTLCNYKDQFPIYPSIFVWGKESIFSKTGGWGNSKEEYNEILSRIFSDPYYLSLFAYKGIISSLKQLFTFEIEVRRIQKSEIDTRTIKLIHDNFKHEEKKFKSSLQFRDLNLDLINRSYYILCAISFSIIILFFLSHRPTIDSNLWFLVLILFAGVISNAAINGTFSNVVPRYQARINWVLVLLALIIIEKNFIAFIRFIINRVNNKGVRDQ